MKRVIFSIVGWVLRALFWWFFLLPWCYSIFVFVLFFLAIQMSIGDQSIHLFNRSLGGVGSCGYNMFWLFLGGPCFISFFTLFGASTHQIGDRTDDKLKRLIAFRSGQILHKGAKEGYEIYKKTALLDVMNDNENDEVIGKVKRGFNASHLNRDVTTIYEEFIGKNK
ncbi:hypothetical protein H9Y05_06810 [Crocinitomicaceae bacterium CZZ-1]|uniref:Uncharacterized protein n=1 Tax=Taishania pollutisoli TaxID=2766479 RepID=A0A8J6TSG5_9FLAO|nr:hypothetical protein [Taishania pollutisoli]MBC9812187.1 hypothetical protein [Taishania pollutisoli]